MNMGVNDTGLKKLSFAKRMYSTHLLDLKDSLVKNKKTNTESEYNLFVHTETPHCTFKKI